MNRNLTKLVEVLRSGEFPQATGRLRTKRGYCCLGVACEMFRRETGEGRWVQSDEGGYDFIVDGSPQNNFLPIPVSNWLGLADGQGILPSSAPGQSLAGLNDTGSSFEQIAAVIEHEWARP